jgi:hypothetical protein
MGSSSFDYDLRLKIVGAAARGSIAIIQDSIYNFGVFPLMNGLAERGAVSFVAYRDDHRFHYYFTLAKEGTNLTGGVVELDYGSSNAPIRSGITAVGLFTVPATNDPSLVAYYPFNGNAHDEAGNGHDGTVYGARLATDQFGFADSAYSFDGTNSFIQVPHHADLNVSPSGFTVAGWFKANPVQLDPGALYDIVDKSHWSGDQLGWTIQARTADWGTEGIDFTFAGTGAGVDAPVFDDQWHHFGATHDGTNAAFYLDGTLRQTGPTPLPGANGRDLFIGMHYQVQRHFRGIIDEVRIYRRSLAPNEMAQLYQNP